MLRNGTNPVDKSHTINPMGELVCFQYLKQPSREQNLTRKTTAVELCDGDTNLVVVKTKKAKSIPEIAEIKIDTLD